MRICRKQKGDFLQDIGTLIFSDIHGSWDEARRSHALQSVVACLQTLIVVF